MYVSSPNALQRAARPLARLACVVAALSMAPATRAADEEKEKPDYKPFEEVTKGYEAIDGFFPLYYNAKTDNLLAVIPKGMVGQDFLMARSVTSGGDYTGYQFGHSLVRWEEFNKKLLLVEPELRRIRNEQSTLEDVIDRTYTDHVLLVTPILTKRGNDPVIDLDAVFKRDPDDIGQVFGGKMDPTISKWAERKAFADNLELAVEGVFMGRDGGSKVTMHYSISRLPKSDYRPREADERIGYFITARQDWSAPHDAPTTFKRYINRWHLRKAEPDKEISDVHPDDQIVFYIEKTVPVKFRRYVREGILLWNKAFEQAGLRNAVAVRQQTDSNEFAHLDPEDVNYNFFRWIVSGRSFAMGPSRANPLTGQILDADIIMDDSMARVWYDRYDNLLARGPASADDPALTAFLDTHHDWAYEPAAEKLMPGLEGLGETSHEFEPAAQKLLAKFQPQGMCTYANGVAHEMCLGAALLEASPQPGAGRDEFVGQWIKLVACHEVGHTLGLRHNFKASSWKSLEEILANNDPETPTTASVMDYNPAVYNLDRSLRRVYLSQTIGPYDELAIEYGYRVPSGKEKEETMLAGIAARVAGEGLDFATDENSSFLAPDPLVNTYDNTSDPLAWANYRMNLVDNLRSDMTNWAVKDGESYERLRKTFDMLMFEYSRSARFAVRLIGGQYLHRDFRGDPQGRQPVEIVPVEQQKAALDFVNQRVLAANAFEFDPSLLNQLAPGRWRHWGSDAFDAQEDYPVHDRVLAVQYWVLFHMTNPITVRRVYDAELKVPAGDNALTLNDLLGDVTNVVWADLDVNCGAQCTARTPFLRSVRRNLQREHVRMLTRIVLSQENGEYPADAIAVARMTLTNLSDRINGRVGDGFLDAATRAHLVDTQARITKALEAGYEL